MRPPSICPGCRLPAAGACPRCGPAGGGGARRVPGGGRKRTGYTRGERLRRADAVRAHVQQFGRVCPGWQREAHPADDLTADHEVPVGAGGREGGPLRVLCRSCNSARGASMAHVRVPGLDVVLVAGPPCAGKSTFVRAHGGDRDLVLDFDALADAMSLVDPWVQVDAHVPLISEARDAVLERLLLGGHDVRRCWVLATAPKRATRAHYRNRYGARVVLLMPSEETCLLRAMRDRPEPHQGWVRKWFDAYEPDAADEVLRDWREGSGSGEDA
ncbi:hypothetical protein [Streptomyces sp. NPDC045251]|uniref:hypothetical protein n=1 Tax=unclassified Streptomyces TaxID=2593676 RepID=UPI0034040C86